MKTEIVVTVTDKTGFKLREMHIETDSPIPDSIAVGFALRKHFGDLRIKKDR